MSKNGFDPHVIPLQRGEINFGQVPEMSRLHIICAAKTEVHAARHQGAFDPDSPIAPGELKGPNTQGLIIGNNAAFDGALNALGRKGSVLLHENTLTRDDLRIAAISKFGNTILGYDPDQGGFYNYVLIRARTVMQQAIARERRSMAREYDYHLKDMVAGRDNGLDPFRTAEDLILFAGIDWSALSPGQRSTIELYFGLSGNVSTSTYGIAGSENVTPQAVQIRLGKALRNLRKQLSDKETKEEQVA